MTVPNSAASVPKTGTGGIIGGTAAAVMLAAALFIAPWEGRKLVAYRDVGNIWSICEGVTAGVRPGQTATNAECDRLLATEVGKHYAGMAACITQPVTVNQMTAIVSWAYNVGVGAGCRSSLIARLNEGQPASVWCRQLLRWNKVQGKIVRGLTRRREAEYRVCVS